MDTQNIHQEREETPSSDYWFHRCKDEDKEDTLSLSDLPLYGDDWESSQESGSFSSHEDDFFEFFSQEHFNPSPPAAGFPMENIIFCGKLIPYRQPYCDAKSPSESRKQEAHKNQDFEVSSDKQIAIPPKKVKGTSTNSTFERYIDSKNDKKIAIPQKKVKGTCDLQVRKFPVITSSSSGKAKWYLYFGISRFSSLNGVDSRRSRRQYPQPAFRFGSGDKNSSDHRDIGWRMEGLIGVLSCGGHRRADTMVAASIGRAPLK